jgi:hypothetical protein
MNCFECAIQDRVAQVAVGICHDCGAAVCERHAVPRAHYLTRTAAILREESVEPAARTLRCQSCDAAWAAQHKAAHAEAVGG